VVPAEVDVTDTVDTSRMRAGPNNGKNRRGIVEQNDKAYVGRTVVVKRVRCYFSTAIISSHSDIDVYFALYAAETAPEQQRKRFLSPPYYTPPAVTRFRDACRAQTRSFPASAQ